MHELGARDGPRRVEHGLEVTLALVDQPVDADVEAQLARLTPRAYGSLRTRTKARRNGEGFFVVQKPSSITDNRPVFDGIDRYTRRGDFQPDKNGYLVNGAGYYLMGIPIDPTTGNLVRQRAATAAIPERLPARAGDHVDRLPRQPCELSAHTGSTTPACPGPSCSIPSTSPPIRWRARRPRRKIAGQDANLLADAPAVWTGTADLSSLARAAGQSRPHRQRHGDHCDRRQRHRGPGGRKDQAAGVQAARPGITASLDPQNHLVLTSGNYQFDPSTVGRRDHIDAAVARSA